MNEIRIIDFETAKEFAEAKGFQYIETSARDGTGTLELIEILAENVIKKNSMQNEIRTQQNIVKQIGIVSEPSLTSFF